ncbi:hypothetical protein DSL92_03720 [Billgrantia gudaonensis]|uniref:Uncharacterized protein n=1 Tax=Billgrantia gudaonensis TaxID=376427 RepID=A0A3S0NEA1_9GAMM|nr:hypothetical protein DSL92_03720 [Halomonas gudaonensis]
MLFSLGEKPDCATQAREALARFGHVGMIDYLIEMCRRVLDETSLLPMSTPARSPMKGRPSQAGQRQHGHDAGERQPSTPTARPGPYACPDKVPTQRLRTLERAGQHDVPFTTGILIGIGETWESASTACRPSTPSIAITAISRK